jgi:molecular chaperone DnaK
MSIVGFDFGTTNSVISFCSGGKCIPILDELYPHPSVVSYRPGEVVVGRKAKEELINAVPGIFGNIVKSPKTMLGRNSVTIGGHTFSPQNVVKDVVAHVMSHARLAPEARGTDNQFNRAVVTIPIDMNGERRRDLRDACRMAGMSVYQFVHEPLAALYGHLRNMDDFKTEFGRLNRQLVLVFDWGGGTLDLTLCRVSDGMLVQVLNDGLSDVGGDIIDDMIVNQIEQKVLASRGINHSVGHQIGAQSRLRSAAEAAKIALSSEDMRLIYVPDYFMPGVGDVDLEYRLSRAELEQAISIKVNQGVARIDALLKNARLEPSGVALCLATGGMINMPLIQAKLYEIFGAARVEISSKGNTIISEGAAWIAHDQARLMLAKNIEVLVARSTYFPVIHAGSLMPRENEIHQPPKPLTLYCSDPTDGVAKIILNSPKRNGRSIQVNDERDILGTLSVKVDQAQRPLIERLALDVTIDENLVLLVKATSTIAADVDQTEIHSLEFGLQVGPTQNEDPPTKIDDLVNRKTTTGHKGQIQLRPNIATSDTDYSVIPGEVLYKFDQQYFNRSGRHPPPPHQEHEQAMYKPCIVCQEIYCQCGKNNGKSTLSNTGSTAG